MMYEDRNRWLEDDQYDGLYLQNTRHVRRFKYSDAQAGMFVFNAMLLVLLGAWMLWNTYRASASPLGFVRTPIGYWRADTEFLPLCLFSLMCGFMFMIHAASIRRHMLIVTETGICGTTAGVFGANPRNFRLSWDEIWCVQKIHSSQLKIMAAHGVYKVYLSRCREAEDLIQSILEKLTDDPSDQLRQQENDSVMTHDWRRRAIQ